MSDVRMFTCDMCGGTFEQGWTDEEAEAEYAGSFNELSPEQKEDRGEVCDDCYKVIMGEVPHREGATP